MTVGFVLDGSCQTAASSNWWASGRAALASNDIVTANYDFSNAVVASSTDPDANFFYAASRIAILPCETNAPVGPVAQLLTDYGVPTTGRNLWHWTADFRRNLFEEIVLTNNATEGYAVGVLTNTVLPEIDGALDNLSQVPTNYIVTLSNELNRATPVVLSNADVLIFQAGLETAEAFILTVSSYNLNVSFSALLSNAYAHTFDFSNDVLAAYPGLLTAEPGAGSNLPEASTNLNEAISAYVSGLQTIKAQQQHAARQRIHFHHLLSTNAIPRLQEIQAALSGDATVSFGTSQGTPISEVLDLARFFSSSPINLASKEPQTIDDPLSGRPRIVYNSFPDATFGGILPEFTEQLLMSLLKTPIIMLPGDTNWEAAIFGPSGLDCDAYAIAVSGTNVYVGGCFYTAGTTNNYVNGIALWNGTSWSSLGGVSGQYGGSVNALAISGTNLYVGGSFTNAGGVAANNIAVWDGSGWSTLGTGVGGPYDQVNAVAVSAHYVLVGGSFTNGAGQYVPGLGRWDGSNWQFGYLNNQSGSVKALALSSSGTNLFVGGSFTNVTVNNTVAVNNIFVVDSSGTVSALGSGVSGFVKCPTCGGVESLLVSGTNLYVGGIFTNAGGLIVNNIAVWDGNNWSALGGGVGGNVGAMTLIGTNLYVGGGFTNADVVSANDIAVWNGYGWSSMGSGVGTANDDANGNEYVESMGTDGTNLFVGGDFGSAGGWKASNFALWQGTGALVPCDVSPESTSANFTAAGGSNTVTVTANEVNCAWTAVSNDSFIRITSGANYTGDGTVSYTVATNASTTPVIGTMTIAGQTFTVTEGASACSVSPASTNANFTAAGGSGAATVTANGTNCAWTAASNSGFITIISGTNGTGSGTVHYSVAANTSSNEVTGTMTIAGQTFTVVESGVGCNFVLASTGESFDAAGGSSTVTVTASASNCTWGAFSNDSFITITSGSSSAGNGTVSYTVAANTGAARTGTMTIAGQTFTIDQIGGASQVTFSLTNPKQTCKTKKGTTNTTCTVAFDLVVKNTGTTEARKSTVLLWLGQGSIFNPNATDTPAPLTKKLGALKAGKSETIKMKSKKLTGDQAGTFIFATDTQNNVLAFAEVPSP
jgi:hypothetical protein